MFTVIIPNLLCFNIMTSEVISTIAKPILPWLILMVSLWELLPFYPVLFLIRLVTSKIPYSSCPWGKKECERKTYAAKFLFYQTRKQWGIMPIAFKGESIFLASSPTLTTHWLWPWTSNFNPLNFAFLTSQVKIVMSALRISQSSVQNEMRWCMWKCLSAEYYTQVSYC